MAALLGCMPTPTPLLISSTSLLTLPCFTVAQIYILISTAPISSLSPPPTQYRWSHTCACWNAKNKKHLGWLLPSTHWSSPVSVCGWHSPDLHSSEPALLLHSHRHIAVLVGTVTLSLSWPMGTTGTTCWEPPQNNSCVPCEQNSKSWVRCELACISQNLDYTYFLLVIAQLLLSYSYCLLFSSLPLFPAHYLISHGLKINFINWLWGGNGKGKRDWTSKKFWVSHKYDQIPLLSASLKQEDVQLSKWELNHVHRDKGWEHLSLQLVTIYEAQWTSEETCLRLAQEACGSRNCQGTTSCYLFLGTLLPQEISILVLIKHYSFVSTTVQQIRMFSIS